MYIYLFIMSQSLQMHEYIHIYVCNSAELKNRRALGWSYVRAIYLPKVLPPRKNTSDVEEKFLRGTLSSLNMIHDTYMMHMTGYMA